jgi:hypothetical protein
MKRQANFLLPCATLLLAGCAANSVSIKVDSEVPVPVAEKLALEVGVWYDEQFAGYVYEEDSEDRPDWRIESGASHTAMFDRVLGSMFTRVDVVNGLPPGAGQGLDLVLVPKVEEMQFSTPAETKTDFYEAWVRYGVSVYEPDGNELTSWRFEGYGRSSTEFLKNVDKGMNEAINVALRDAGAKLVTRFRNVPEISDYLNQDQPGAR